MLRVLRSTRQRGNPRAIACSAIDKRRDMRCQAFVEETKLQIAVVDRDRIAIVRVLALSAQLERHSRAQAGDDVLPPFKRDACDLGMEARRVGNRRIRIGKVLLALCKDAIEKRADCTVLGRGLDLRLRFVESAKSRLERRFRGRRRSFDRLRTGYAEALRPSALLLRDAQLVLSPSTPLR